MDAPAAPLDTSVAIETPEHIVFRYRIAGPARRMLAYMVDLLLLYGMLAVIIAIIAIAGIGASIDDVEGASEKLGIGLVLLLVFAAQWIWFVVWEALRGASPGKMACGLSVVTTTGRPIGFAAAALRNVLRAADALPTGYAVGLGAMAVSPRFQRLGDLVAGTMVIVPERPRAATVIRVFPPPQPHELQDLPDDVRLDADERTAIEMFLRRRGTLGAARERELAEILAGPLAERFGYRLADPARALAVLYDRAANGSRGEAPPSSRFPMVRGV